MFCVVKKIDFIVVQKQRKMCKAFLKTLNSMRLNLDYRIRKKVVSD